MLDPLSPLDDDEIYFITGFRESTVELVQEHKILESIGKKLASNRKTIAFMFRMAGTSISSIMMLFNFFQGTHILLLLLYFLAIFTSFNILAFAMSKKIRNESIITKYLNKLDYIEEPSNLFERWLNEFILRYGVRHRVYF